ncbi:326_t:CDS:2 [Paraglomus occultum]|uniref:326_t:CDS:1 n=1 Tax=Paraglomus occultum TaxID=144539 RepID=A0A9N8W8S4_9GLOM|nr:326_t:CDS:2 [Paraglomus occultum]
MYDIKHISFISDQTVGSVLNEKQNIQSLIEISVNATVEEAFDLLLAENILSVPVYRRWRGRREPIAIVNVFDLVTFVALQPIFDQDDNMPVSSSDADLESQSEFLQRSIGELIGLTPESTNLTTVSPDDSLVKLINIFTRKQIHRLLVFDRQSLIDDDGNESLNEEEHKKPCFISQTDAVKFLFKHNHELGKVLDTPASEVANKACKLIPERQRLLCKPSSVTIHDQALTAFRRIHQDRVNAVAVVNDDGSLVGEVSAADLRGLNRERVKELKKPVIAFLKSCKGALIEPLTCSAKFTLSQVMAGIIRNKTHRAWLVDDDDVPIGVITLSDILCMFLPNGEDANGHLVDE